MSTKILYNGQNKENARYLRKNMTRQERKIWYDFLRNHKYKWYRQRRIENYIVDFYCDKLHLVIEIDGGQHYEERQKAYDEERTKMLNNNGIEVIRIANNEVDRNFLGVCQYLELRIENMQ